MLAPCTSRQLSCPRKHPTCCTSSQRCDTVSSTPCDGVRIAFQWTTASLSTQMSIYWECMISQIESPLYVPRATTHQFISRQHQQKRSAFEGLPVEWWVLRNRCESPSFHHESGSHSLVIAVPSTAWVRLNRLPTVSDVSPTTYTSGVWSLLRDADQQTVDRVVL